MDETPTPSPILAFVADEGVDAAIIAGLRQDKHDVFWVAEQEPGASDDVVLRRADERAAVLVTEDKDFGELVFRLGRAHNGVLLARLNGLSSAAKAAAVRLSVAVHGAKMAGAFSVVSPGLVRIRKP